MANLPEESKNSLTNPSDYVTNKSSLRKIGVGKRTSE